MKQDARAVENPIAAIFDLSEKVARQAPQIKKMVRYSTIFIGIWLMITFLIIIALMVSGNIIMALIMFLLFVIGFIALRMLRKMNRFFRYYAARHRAIKSVREMDPMVYAPQGKTPTERFIAYLKGHNPAISRRNVEVAMPGIVHGKMAMEYRFDAYIKEPASGFWKIFGRGRHGFAIYIKEFEGAPTLKAIRSFKEAVEDVSARHKIPPIRIVALWERKEDQTLNDEVYTYVMNKPATIKRGFRKFTCSMEIVSETDGKYDFIPHMVTGKRRPKHRRTSRASS